MTSRKTFCHQSYILEQSKWLQSESGAWPFDPFKQMFVAAPGPSLFHFYNISSEAGDVKTPD
jgi:hypothetical protein